MDDSGLSFGDSTGHETRAGSSCVDFTQHKIIGNRLNIEQMCPLPSLGARQYGQTSRDITWLRIHQPLHGQTLGGTVSPNPDYPLA